MKSLIQTISLTLILTLNFLQISQLQAQCHIDDWTALKALYESTDGDNWSNRTGWDLMIDNLNSPPANCDLSTLYGVRLTNGRVTCIDLDGKIDCNNTGNIHAVGGNNLVGYIPAELGSLIYLNHLSFTANDLTGNIPAELGNLTNLLALVLNYNELSGSIPPELGNLNNLNILWIINNQLSGNLPAELGNLTNLTSLWLRNNQLTGNIPAEIADLANLTYLGLDSNQLTGIPVEIDNLTSLEILHLGNNQITDIPVELQNLDNLEVLDLSGNSLSGDIPIGLLINLNNLTQLKLSGNDYTGTIPAQLANLNKLRYLNLSYNELTGSIPPDLGNLSELTTLHLSGNNLSGAIPSELSNLRAMKELWLSENQLTGSIPPEFDNLISLTRLQLRLNDLSGCYDPNLMNLCYQLSSAHNSNYSISSGNSFDAQWDDFCDNGIGACSNPYPSCRLSDSLVLVDLYNATNGPAWINGWDFNQPIDTWYGVSLNGFGCVACIDLDGNDNCWNTENAGGNNLSGTIPSSLSNLSNLRHLILNENSLSGNIPAAFGNLENLLGLYLSNNQLTGGIPKEMGNLDKLSRLFLNDNQLSGCYDINLSNLCGQLNVPSSHFSDVNSGNSFDAIWDDFCATGTGACIVSDDVFPGDCNTDGIVNIDDMLYWGLAVGFTGAPRPNAATDCNPQACPDWSQLVGNPNMGNPLINGKHQDSDGNGIINGEDSQVILDNYGCVNNYTAPTYASGAPIYRVQPQGINNNGKYQYDIYVENGSGAAAVAHGLAFTITSDVIPISSIVMSATGSSLHPDLEFAIIDGNQCHAALTRIDNFDVTCAGPIATLLIETDDVPLDIPFEINITSGSKIKADATLDNITGVTAFGMYSGAGASSSNLLLDASVTHEQCNGLGGAIAIPSGGTSPYTYAWSTGANTVQVGNLASGTYTVTVTDANGLNQSLTLQINGQTPIYDANGNLLCGNLCPEYLAPSGVTGSGLYNASNALNSDAIIPADNTAAYKAGQTIQLKSGFKVQPNAEFSAEIQDCQ